MRPELSISGFLSTLGSSLKRSDAQNEISQEVARAQVGSVAHFDDERVTPARYALASLAVRHGRGQVDGGDAAATSFLLWKPEK